MEHLEQYRQRFTTLMDEWDLRATRGVTSFDSKYAGDAQWQAMPVWTYEPPGIGFALRSAWPDFAALALWLVAALTALALTARRVAP